MRLIKFLETIQSIPPILQGLAAEARKTSSFEEFQRDFLGQIKHGTYWHITDNPQFTIDPKLGPRDLSSMSAGSISAGKLMITSHLEHWEEFYNTHPETGERMRTRPHAALIDMSDVPREAYRQVSRGFGNEFFISDPSKARVVSVMPIEKAIQYNERAHAAIPQSFEELEQFYQQATGKEQVSASVGSNEGERNSEDDPNLKMNPKKIVPKGSALSDAGTSSGWDWMDATHGYDRGSMSMLEAKLLGPHEDREFGLLMRGKKKFAMPSSVDLERNKEKYQKAVQAGKLIYTRWVHDGYSHNFFAIPGEEWRIEKAKEIYQTARGSGSRRNWYLKREQHIELGRLLGYTDEEINAFLNRIGERKVTETPYRQASASSRRGRGDYINTYKNPSMRELRTLSKTSARGDVSAYIVGNDLVAWPSQGAEHDEIASQFKLPNSAIPLSLLVDHGDRSVLAIVTSHSGGTDWHHNHETANAIRSSGYMSGFSDVEVDYYDSGEVGDWEQPASSYSFEDDADEAIGTYKTIGDFDKSTIGFKKAADRRIITNPKLIQKTKDKFARTDHPFNFYFVNMPGVGKHSELGMVGRDWLDEKIPKASKQIPTDNMHVNVIFVGNTAAEWKPMTPWIMAHRIGHVFQRAANVDKLYSWKEAERTLMRVTNYIFENGYGKKGLSPQRRLAGYDQQEYEKVRFDQRTFKFYWQNVATFRSAREGKIRDWFEVLHELFAQYLTTGKIRFNPLPKSLSKAGAFKTQPIYVRFQGNEQDYEYLNGMLGDLAEELQEHFENAINEATGHFFVM